jgi:hypothetical protein
MILVITPEVPESKKEAEKRIKELEKKVYAALKGVTREDIRTVCNRISRFISATLSREKKIANLSKELDELKRKK